MCKKRSIIIFITSVFIFLELCFGMIELYYLNDTKEYMTECYHVWTIIAIGSAVNLFIFIFSCTIIFCTEKQSNQTNHNNILYDADVNVNDLIKIQLLQRIPGLCGAIIYYTISDQCQNLWMSIEQQLLTFIFIYSIIFWTFGSMFILIMICGLIIMCGCLVCNNMCPSKQTVTSIKSTPAQILNRDESNLEYKIYVY